MKEEALVLTTIWMELEITTRVKSAGAEVAYDLTPVESKKLILEKLNIM